MAVNLISPSHLLPISGIQIGSTQAIKSHKRHDLTVITIPEKSTVAGVFTKNRFPAPPVQLCREFLSKEDVDGTSTNIRALTINAGIANAGTLGAGLEDAKQCCHFLAQLLNYQPSQILPFSTGVIMERLPMQRYTEGLQRCVKQLKTDNWLAAANAIMTTDTVAKGTSRQINDKTITGIAKGSGMIHPNMATMLAFIATDATIPPALLSRWQKEIVANSFNVISIDGDTSTNDSFILIATGSAKTPTTNKEKQAIKAALMEVCMELAEAIVRDGEGATKLITINVCGGKNLSACKKVAEAIACSPLVKTAIAASDANVGRLLMAMGNAGDVFDPTLLQCSIGDVPVIAGGGIHPQYDEEKASILLKKDEITLSIRIGDAPSSVTYKTCDLTHRYIDINASYRS